MTSATHLPDQGLPTLTTFTAAAIHDGLFAAVRAKEALRWLDHVLTPYFRVRTMSWSFQQLERLDVRSMALRSAGAAQMILVAGSGNTTLPPHIERWLDGCLFEHRARRTILVALSDEGIAGLGGREDSFLRSLRQFAARWQAEVMTGEELDEAVHPEFVRQRFLGPAAAAMPHVGRRPSPEFEGAPRFYGIND